MLSYVVEKNQKFASAKKKIQQKNDANNKNAVSIYHHSRIVKILELGLYTSRLVKKRYSYAQVDKKKLQQNINSLRRIKLTFFKVPEIYIDYLQRSWTNSFKMFLKQIYKSPRHFPKWKLQSADSWRNISVRLDILKNKYREF